MGYFGDMAISVYFGDSAFFPAQTLTVRRTWERGHLARPW
jgi:hypothetical protein